MSDVSPPSPGRAAELACLLEVIAPKAGNVHPGASFADVTWLDFVRSAHAIAPAMQEARKTGIGSAILAAVRATRNAIGRNTNLGIILLLAPLCACATDDPRDDIARVMQSLTPEDAVAVYEAIRTAAPGGLGDAPHADVRDEPPDDLITAMALAADRDAVARQYAHGFRDIFDRLVPSLCDWLKRVDGIDQAVVGLHLEQIAHEPDSLIVRKVGREVARYAQHLAQRVLAADWPSDQRALTRFDQLDQYLREDGHRRNPGTSADLVTATLFVGIRTGLIAQPLRLAGTLDEWMDEPCAY